MELKILNKTQNKLVFRINGINPALANTLRRLMMVEVPVLAVDTVEFTKNSSALYDEMIAHRLGLVPLKTDLKSYNLKDECKCKGKGCALCELKLTLKKDGPGMVYSSDLKSTDPKATPVYNEMPIVELTKKQSLELIATAILGKGKKHARFSPGLIYYRGYPMFNVKDKSKLKKVEDELKDVVTIKSDNIQVKDMLKWNERHEEILEMNDIEITNSREDFLFFVESWGQLKPEEIFKKALEIFDEKLDDFSEKLKKAK
ncbi:MAG: DNA-directed RNA polymerase subunit D [Nanoarchaeota archaeon]